ncbi:YbjN domain-containing protein [Nostoc flagelliforme FACHB-838]|uniref:YbjN domain-containing protein n=1 Tax=Nostoc flagelliforme FACHB-838 TaxID=2692904 RepID=A0ABR8E144_9NOSO|nr:YbjN domain-containing protein [Nostoc flagelliforme]MBD2534950.1 YbjN domain-containing protein [Nostoc flagelliforme FACHB-838]
MSNNIEYFRLEKELILHAHTHSPLNLHTIFLSLTKQDDQLIECRLTFQVSPKLYKRIETEALFNLKPDVRNPVSGGEFLPEGDIIIETSLKPDLLLHLVEHAVKIDETATYLLNLGQEQPENPLLFTENWLCLSVKQQQDSGEIGYRTLWSYISPTALAHTATSSEEISQGIVNFFQDWAKANLSTKAQKSSSKMLAGINKFLTELADINVDKITQGIEASFPLNLTNGDIFEEVVNFFKADGWPFIQLVEQPALQIAFQGENGQWTCYARVRTEQQQFVFYSISPVNAPEDKRLAIAEFLTRANSGMIIGNFELDFADGEISYKTSIDVEGDRLSSALIQRVVYANVTMMDEYLPGILSVIYGNLSPEEAIAQIE